MPEIRKFLTCAAAHLPLDFVRKLEKPMKDWPVSGGPTPFGFFIFAHDDDCDGAIGPEVMAVFDFARSIGCDYVYFDQDADPIDSLPLFEPEEITNA